MDLIMQMHDIRIITLPPSQLQFSSLHLQRGQPAPQIAALIVFNKWRNKHRNYKQMLECLPGPNQYHLQTARHLPARCAPRPPFPYRVL